MGRKRHVIGSKEPRDSRDRDAESLVCVTLEVVRNGDRDSGDRKKELRG